MLVISALLVLNCSPYNSLSRREKSFNITLGGPLVETSVKLLIDDQILLDSTITSGMDGVAHTIFLIPSPDKKATLNLTLEKKEYIFTVPKMYNDFLIIEYQFDTVNIILSDKDYPRM